MTGKPSWAKIKMSSRRSQTTCQVESHILNWIFIHWDLKFVIKIKIFSIWSLCQIPLLTQPILYMTYNFSRVCYPTDMVTVLCRESSKKKNSKHWFRMLLIASFLPSKFIQYFLCRCSMQKQNRMVLCETSLDIKTTPFTRSWGRPYLLGFIGTFPYTRIP